MNELSLSNNLNQIELEINHHKQMAGNSIWEIGRRLNHVKDHDLAHGEFVPWIESLGFSRQYANRFMKIAREIPEVNSGLQIGVNTLYEIATLPDEQKEKELQKAEEGNPSTKKEVQELKRQLKQKDETIKQLDEMVQHQEPKVIEKEVVKTIHPPDYDSMKSDIRELSSYNKESRKEVDYLQKEKERIERDYQAVLKDREQDLERKEKLELYERELKKLASRKDRISNEMETVAELSNLKSEVSKLLEKIAPYYFNSNINVIRQDPSLEHTFLETVDAVQKWCDDMYALLGKQNTLEGEIIDG